MRLLDVATGEERVAAAAHRGSVRDLDFARAGGALLSAGADATLRTSDREGRRASVRPPGRPVVAVASLPASRVAAVEEGRVHVYDVASGWEVTGAPLPDFPTYGGVAVAANPGLLAVGGTSALNMVELATAVRRSSPIPRKEVALAFSPDGRFALWSGRVVDPQDDEDRAIARFNARIHDDDRVEHVLLSVRDGMMLARKR